MPKSSDKQVLPVPVVYRVAFTEGQLRVIKEALQTTITGMVPFRSYADQYEVLTYVMALLGRIEQASEDGL